MEWVWGTSVKLPLQAHRARRDLRWTVATLVIGLCVPAMAYAAGGEGEGAFGPILFALAVLVMAAKLAGLVVERWGQPAVLGELLVGVGLGNLVPTLFGNTGIEYVRSQPTLLVLMGIGVKLQSLARPSILALGAVLIVCAIAGKFACTLGVLEANVNRLAVAIGMIPRGEVGLIFAGIGMNLTIQGRPILTEGAFSAIVLMVLVTTLVAPIGLRWAFARPRVEA